jgi:hypothetical protein
MRRSLLVGFVTCALLGVGSPALAGSSGGGNDLGTLQDSDMPNGFVLESEPSVEPTGMTIVVDGDACTQAVEPVDELDQLAIARFKATDADQTLMSEAVASFDSVRAAKASYKERASGAKAAIKCGTVDVLRDGSRRPVATLRYQKLRFPNIGDQSYAVTVGAKTSGMRSTTVVFRSGSDVVYLNTFGFEGEPSVKQLKAIARKAEKRLAKGS